MPDVKLRGVDAEGDFLDFTLASVTRVDADKGLIYVRAGGIDVALYLETVFVHPEYFSDFAKMILYPMGGE